jgi:transposase
MSLKPSSDCVVPERTASVARAAFPKGSLCIRIFDELGTIFQDQDFGVVSVRRRAFLGLPELLSPPV